MKELCLAVFKLPDSFAAYQWYQSKSGHCSNINSKTSLVMEIVNNFSNVLF